MLESSDKEEGGEKKGRKRILQCLAECGAEHEPVILFDLQMQYFKRYDSYLDKNLLRKFFGKKKIKRVFEQFMADDVDVDVTETGTLYLRMKRPLSEALATEPLVQAKNRVPVHVAELKSAPKLVPLLLDGIPALKPVGTLKKLSNTVPVYSLSVLKPKGSGTQSAKGNAKMAASSTAKKTPLSKMVKTGKNYLDDEKKNGGFEFEYAPSEAPYEPKSAKAVTVSDVVKSKQANDDVVLFTDSENDDIEEDSSADKDEEEEEGKFKLAAKIAQIMKKQPDDMKDEKNDKVYIWDIDEEEEAEEEALAKKNDCLLLKSNAAKMAAVKAAEVEKAEKQLAMAASSASQQQGPSSTIVATHCNVEYYIRCAIQKREARRRRAANQNVINEKKGVDEKEEEDNEIGLEEKQPIGLKKKKQPIGTKELKKQPAVVVTKMARRLAAMPEEDGTNSNKAVAKSVGNKPKPKPPVAGNGKWAVPTECVSTVNIGMNSNDKEEEKVEGNAAFTFEEAPSEDEADSTDSGESTKNLVENAAGEGEMAVKMVGIDKKAELMNGNGQMPTAAAARAQQPQSSSTMSEAFKQQMLAIITFAVKRKGIYVASELDTELANECYAAECSAHFPSVDALVQFVRQNCNFVKVHANRFFQLDDAQLDLDRLLQKVGKSLQAAAAN